MPLERFPLVIDLPRVPRTPVATAPIFTPPPPPPPARPPAIDPPVHTLVNNPGPPPVTSELEEQARAQQLEDTARSALIFTGIAGFIGQVVYPRKPVAAGEISRTVTGFEMKPYGSRGRAIPFIGRASLFGLAPVPIGFVPPEVFGLRPDFLVVEEKRKPPEQQRKTGLFVVGLLGGDPGGAREQLANARAADAAREAFRAQAPRLNNVYLVDAFRNPTTAVAGFVPSQIRPGEIRAIAAEELARRGLDLDGIPRRRGVGTPGFTLELPFTIMAGFGPSKIKPVNDKAIANQETAEGIRKVLVHDRADP